MNLGMLICSRSRVPSHRAHTLLVLKTCDAFLGQGADVQLMHPYRWVNLREPDPDLRRRYGLRHTIDRRRLPCVDLPLVERVSPTLWFWISAGSYILVLLAVLFVRYRVRDRREILYVTDFPTAFALLLLRPVFPVPLFLELHDLPDSFRDWRKRWLMKATGFVVNSEGIRGELLEQGFDESRILRVYNGVDLESFAIDESPEQLRRDLELPVDPYLVGFTGNPYPYNGIEIIKQLSRRMRDVHFVCVGGSREEHENLREFRRGLAPDNLTLVPHQPHPLVPRYLRSFDCLLLPLQDVMTRTREYATPMKLFEYLASARPIVASDLPSLRRILDDEQTALLCDPSDAGAFRDAITRLREDPALADRLATNARGASRRYSWDARARKILAFVEEHAEALPAGSAS